MVTTQQHSNEQLIILKPNCSSSWAGNRLLLIAITLISLAIAGGFAAIGAWLIIPFAGLEILGLTAALYWVSWKLNYRHVLHFEGSELCIEKGVYCPKQVWHWRRDDSAILVSEQHPLSPLRISLCCKGEEVSIGDFLSRDDSRALLRSLQAQGLPVRHYSHNSALQA